ncbi:MAG TPA: hypothetical protein DCM07_21405 [Planctomycetaceae bacterium]|nr:hypothetical protein [Planctomycetaceae bacterium]
MNLHWENPHLVLYQHSNTIIRHCQSNYLFIQFAVFSQILFIPQMGASANQCLRNQSAGCRMKTESVLIVLNSYSESLCS